MSFDSTLETCEFLPFSRLLAGLSQQERDEFTEGNAPFSWGDNNRTLVTVSRVVDYILHCDLNTPNLFGRLESLPGDLYLDLEN